MSYLATLVDTLTQGEFTLATAESCTGGAVGAALTSVSGSSAYYPGGVITYANAAKMQLLGVDAQLLKDYGAVSRECAEAMAVGCRRLFAATFAVSITGIAGPSGGTPGKPVGTVHIGVAGPQGAHVTSHLFTGDREAVRRQSVEAALHAVLSYIRGKN